MTHTTTIIDEGNHPIHRVLVRLDVTSLDSAGVEQFDPSTEVDEDTRKSILGQESLQAVNVLEWADETALVTWDTTDEELKAKALSDGSDVADNTTLGEIVLEVIGE